MTSEPNTKRERIYTVIVILILVTTNLYFYVVDPLSIFEFLGLELFYLLIFGLYERLLIWTNTKYKQIEVSHLDEFMILYIFFVVQIMPGVLWVILGETDLSSLQIPIFGMSVMILCFLLARAIVRQIQFTRQSSETQDPSQQATEL
ncbi:MAG: hypothetical protein ACFFF9_03575 [Candidatus Thorarchaeota archaeon]